MSTTEARRTRAASAHSSTSKIAAPPSPPLPTVLAALIDEAVARVEHRAAEIERRGAVIEKAFGDALAQLERRLARQPPPLPTYVSFQDLKRSGVCQTWPKLHRLVADAGMPRGVIIGGRRVFELELIKRWLASRPTEMPPDSLRGGARQRRERAQQAKKKAVR
jgi:hypothetical protein